MRMTHLRHICVFVDEPDPGHLHWVLHESTGDACVWTDIEASERSFETWASAWEHGVIALQRLVGDPILGPRAPGADHSA